MATINIPDGLLTDSELRELQKGVNDAVDEKKRTGWMTMSRFMDILKSACRWIWDKISGFFADIWSGLCDIFS